VRSVVSCRDLLGTAITGGNRRGVALMLVLWLIVVISAIGASVTAATRVDAGVAVNVRARVAGRYAAESGLVLASARLDTLLKGVTREDAPYLFKNLNEQLGNLRDVSVGDAQFTVAVEDLGGRLDLNEASDDMMSRFLAQFIDQREARLAALSMLDWKDAGNIGGLRGSEAASYERASSRFRPTNRPIRRVEELSRMLHVGDSLLYRITPYITVQGDRRININTAPETVLVALPGLTKETARMLVARRRAGEVFTSVNVLYELLGRRFAGSAFFLRQRAATVPSRLLVVSRGWLVGHSLTHEIQAVYSIEGDHLVLRAWQERDL
jgi:general secretion pathway protein K